MKNSNVSKKEDEIPNKLRTSMNLVPFRAPLFLNFDNYKDRRNNYKAYEKSSKIVAGGGTNVLNFNESTSQLSNSR